MKTGSTVTLMVRLFTEPPIHRGTRCKVLGMSGDNQTVFIEGPSGQVARVNRGDVFVQK